jgi:hypothetical protein
MTTQATGPVAISASLSTRIMVKMNAMILWPEKEN